MKISHEAPLSLLEDSLRFNDYQYILPHLMDKYPEYRGFMEGYRKFPNSFIIMDNGLFEGVEHTEADLIEKINHIKPDIFIVPDVWNDSVQTQLNAMHWLDEIKPKLPKSTNLMIVLQGTTLNNIYHLLYVCSEMGFTHFAFNHSSITYQNMFSHKNPLVNQMMGRIQLISYLEKANMLKDKYIHLLGCSLPQEFAYYKDYKIDSVDTSNPIICGTLGIEYVNAGLTSKPTNKIEEFFESNFTDTQLFTMDWNIDMFKEICQQ